MDFLKRLFAVILSLPVIVFGLAYVFLWVVPLDLIKQSRMKKNLDYHLDKPSHPLPIQKLIDKVSEENDNKPKHKTPDNDWSSA